RARRNPGRRCFDHAHHHLGQHQFSHHDDRRKGRGHDPRGPWALLKRERCGRNAVHGTTAACVGCSERRDVAMEGRQPMNLVERVKAILLTPKTEWAVIEGESGDPQYLFTNYVAILAAIPAVCALLGYSIAGLGAGHALIFAIFSYVIYCIVWYVGALVIDALAPTFGARKSLPDALKVAAYSS